MLTETIANIHRASRGCYGVRRIHAELTQGLGIVVGRDQVGRIMNRAGLRGLGGKRKRYVNKEHLITPADYGLQQLLPVPWPCRKVREIGGQHAPIMPHSADTATCYD